MSIQLLKKLPTPTEIKADYPVTQKVAQIKAERDEMIRKVFTGESDKRSEEHTSELQSRI